MTAIPLYAFFENSTSKLGETGLTPAFYIYQVNKATLASTLAVNGLAGTEIARGLYAYVYANGDPKTYDYIGTAETASSAVVSKSVSAIRWDGGEAWATELARMDVAVGSRLATAGYTAPLSSGQTAVAVLDALGADHDLAGTIGESINLILGLSGAADPLLNAVPGSYAQGTGGWALGRIGTGTINVTLPVAADGAVTVFQGDDYSASDGRALDWTDTDGVWPSDLTGATISVKIAGIASLAGSVVTPTGANKKVRLQLTAVQTTVLRASTRPMQVIATLAPSGRTATLVDATWTTKPRVKV